MKLYWSLILILTNLLYINLFANNNDIDTLTNRIRQSYISKVSHNDTTGFKSQLPNGSWKSVQYTDKSMATWKPIQHLNYLKAMTLAYSAQNSKYYHDQALLNRIVRGLHFWFSDRPVSGNWWWNDIGQQLNLEVILLLMKKDLPGGMLETGCKYLNNPKGTGQNKIWYATETIYRGCILNRPGDVQLGLDAIKNELAITDSEGIQADFSFHQHGPQLYNGGYGLDFFRDMVDWAYLVRGTEFAFDSTQINIISRFLLAGTRWMIRHRTIDYSAMGREITRKGIGLNEILPALNELRQIDTSKANEIDSLNAHINGNITQNIIGNKYFWRSDFMTNQRKYYYTSVKMVSDSTIGTESMNGENLKGYWLPFGLTFIYQSGDEYRNIFPVWDWAKLPGVTCYTKVPILKGYQKQESFFVGGVSNGMYGAAAMVLNKDSLRAKKSWFYFDNEFVALGAGITSDKDDSVTTTLNQCLLIGDVTANDMKITRGIHEFPSSSWILHDSIGYFIPAGYSSYLSNDVQKGKWSDINSQYKGDQTVSSGVFKLWIDHGVKPENKDYEYIVFPHTNRCKMLAYARELPVKILVNDTTIQAVQNRALNITDVIFYKQGNIAINSNFEVSVNQPCMILIKQSDGEIEMSLSSPYSQPLEVIVRVIISGTTRNLHFNLPGGEKAGSTVTKVVKI